MTDLDIVIPVYNEGANILPLLESLRRHVKTSYRVLICYDFDEDDTLDAVRGHDDPALEVLFVKNPGHGPNQAIVAGLMASRADKVLTLMADDDYNAGLIDDMAARAGAGADVVTGSRFVPGGTMVGCLWYKKLLTWTASFTLYHIGRLPVHDATNGFRIFSRRLLDMVEIESREGFTYAFELLVKAQRLGWTVDEVPAKWIERNHGGSRFRIGAWILPYLRWYLFAFATTWLGRGAATVPRRGDGGG